MRTNTLFIILTSLISLSFCQISSAEVYSWTDDDGNRVYSDQKTSTTAKPVTDHSKVNYFNASESTQLSVTADHKSAQSNSLSTLEAVDEAEPSGVSSKQQCQQQYGISCDRISNWKQYALEACGNDSRCQDVGFLERKYRPRSIKEIQKIANRAAARNNLQSKKIARFLTRKYTDYCEVQAKQYCSSKHNKNCQQQMLSYCDDPRSLNDIFSRYDNLTVNEKKQIIAQAKALAKGNSDNPVNYDKLIASLINILISQATLGL